MGRIICRSLLILFALAWLAALALLAVGLWGLFGAVRDPLAGVYLIPLGLPWNLLLARLPLLEPALPWVAVGSPLINLLLIVALCRFRPVRSG